ncbi:MAG: RidA family protein [Gemmatimonas sp.]
MKRLLTSVAVAALTMACSVSTDTASGKPGLSVGVSTGAEAKRDIEYLQATSGPARPFSPAVRVNGFLILSGQIGTDSAGLVKGGVVPETRQTMENIKRTLEQNGSSLDQVVKCTVFMVDMKQWQTMNDVYVTYFKPERLPARSASGASGLALGAQVEIECLAAEK